MTERDRLINELKKAKNNCLIRESGGCLACKYRGQADCTLENLADRLLANGVIVAPCYIGQTVYCLIQGFENPLKATVNRITVKVDGVVISCSVLGYFGQSYMATDFGKTVFLTPEEAEKALERSKGNA